MLSEHNAYKDALISEHHVYKDACSTSEYSSLCSLDRLDGMTLREKVLELETNAVKQVQLIQIQDPLKLPILEMLQS